jgi:hypothetical protein
VSRRRDPPHGITRDRARQITERRVAEAGAEGRLPPGSSLVVALVVPLLMRLVDLTVQGTQAAYCGRDYLGRELHKAASSAERSWRGKARDRFSLSTVGRVHRILVALDLIRVKWRYDAAADRWLPALRWLSDSLLAELGQVARARAPRKAKAPTPAELERRRLQSEQAALEAAGEADASSSLMGEDDGDAEVGPDGAEVEQADRARALLDQLRRGPP